MEIWKSITINNNIYRYLYEVSNLGKIRSWNNGHFGRRLFPKILKPGSVGAGYLLVVLCNNLKRKTFKIHRLVVFEFLGLRPVGLEVNHIDGNKLNNNINNLEYCTPKENTRHAINLGLRNKKGVK